MSLILNPYISFPAAGGGNGRAIILDGINDSGTNSDTGTGVPSAQSGWRFMARVRAANLSPGSNLYFFRDTAAAVLVMYAAGGGALVTYVGNAADAAGTIFPASSDFILLVRSNPASTEVSVETWNLDGSNRAAAQNTSATSTATNFQNRNITFGAYTSSSNFFIGKVDAAGFLTGAGTYNAAAPNPLTATYNIMGWTFDADNGNDSSGNGVNLTLNGSPVFEDTP